MAKFKAFQKEFAERDNQFVLNIEPIPPSKTQRSHLIRSILIVIDNTRSMKLKDFKPSRIGLTIQYLKLFINKIFDINPISYIGMAIAQQQLCNTVVQFTSNNKELFKRLDAIEVDQKGNFSLESVIKTTILMFQRAPLYASKQVLLIQSSPSTKDYGDIFQAIADISSTMISFNIISLVGVTSIFQRLVNACQGRYQTVSDQAYFYKILSEMSVSMPFKPERVQRTLFKVTFCKKEIKDYPVFCYCHFEEKTEVFICLICHAKLCRVPTVCAVCGTQVILPGDLYRHEKLKSI